MIKQAGPHVFTTWQLAIILALGTFAMGNAKVSMTLLIPMIAVDLNTQEYLVLYTVWAYFIGAIIGAPIWALLGRNIGMHRNLVLLGTWCFFGNLLSSFANDVQWLLWFRFISGLSHGAFVAAAILYVAKLAPTQTRSIYMGVVMLGVAIATVSAAPLNAWIANQYSWQAAFRFVALYDLLMVLLIHDLLPKHIEIVPKTSIKQQLLGLKDRRIALLFVMEVCIMSVVSAIWTGAYTILYEQSELPLQASLLVGWVLGIGFLAGQLVGTYFSYQNAHKGIAMTCVWGLFSCVFLWLFSQNYRLALIGIMCLSSLTMINVLMQVKLLEMTQLSLYLLFCCFQSALHVGNVVGSSVAYRMMSGNERFDGVFWFCAVMMGVSLLIWWYLNEFEKNQRALPYVH